VIECQEAAASGMLGISARITFPAVVSIAIVDPKIEHCDSRESIGCRVRITATDSRIQHRVGPDLFKAKVPRRRAERNAALSLDGAELARCVVEEQDG